MTVQTLQTTRTNREEFLAANPKQKKVQEAAIRVFNQNQIKFEKGTGKFAGLKVDLINTARLAGEAIRELEQLLPGSQLTLDFWRQMAGKGKNQLHGDFETARQFRFIAEHLDHPIKTPEEAYPVRQAMMSLLGEKTERGEQHRVGAVDEWGFMLNWFDKFNPAIIADFKANPRYFKDGRPKQEFRDFYQVTLHPKLLALQELDRIMESA